MHLVDGKLKVHRADHLIRIAPDLLGIALIDTATGWLVIDEVIYRPVRFDIGPTIVCERVR